MQEARALEDVKPAAHADDNGTQSEADSLKETVQALETRCKALASERDNLRQALYLAQQRAVQPQIITDMQPSVSDGTPGNGDVITPGQPLDAGSERVLSVVQNPPLESGANVAGHTEARGELQADQVLQDGQQAGTAEKGGMLEPREGAGPALAAQTSSERSGETQGIQAMQEPRQIPSGLDGVFGQNQAAALVQQQPASAPGASGEVSPQNGALAVPTHPYMNVETVLAMEAFWAAERAAQYLNVPTFGAYTAPKVAYNPSNDSIPPPAASCTQTVEASNAVTGAAAKEAFTVSSAAHQKVLAENAALLAELDGTRQEAQSATEGREAAAWQLQQASRERKILRTAVHELEDSLRQQLVAQELEAAAAVPAGHASVAQSPEPAVTAQLVSSLLGQIDLQAAEKSALLEQLHQSRVAEAAAADQVQEISFLQDVWTEKLGCLQDECDSLKDALHESGVHLQESRQNMSEQEAQIADVLARLVDEEEHAAELGRLLVAQDAAQMSLHFHVSALEEDVNVLRDEAAEHAAVTADLTAECREAQAELADRSEREATKVDDWASQLASSEAVTLLLQQALRDADETILECRAQIAAQDVANSQLTSDLREVEDHAAALTRHIVALEAVYTALVGQLSGAQQEAERLSDELFDSKELSRHSRSGGDGGDSSMPGGASLAAVLARAASLRAQLAESERRRETLEAQILDLAPSSAAPWSDNPAREDGVATGQLKVQAGAAEGGQGVHAWQRELTAALEDARIANAKSAVLAAHLEDSETRRETMQAQVMDLAAADSAKGWRPVTPLRDDAPRSDVQSPDELLQSTSAAADAPNTAQDVAAELETYSGHLTLSPVSEEQLRHEVPAGLTEEVKASEASLAALQARLAESEHQRADMELRLKHLTAIPSAGARPHHSQPDVL